MEFAEALSSWIEESIQRSFQNASCYSIIGDECTDITAVEELSLFCHWEENGSPMEYMYFLDIIHLKKADAEGIYSALTNCLKQIHLQVSRIVGMGFDGVSTFLGSK